MSAQGPKESPADEEAGDETVFQTLCCPLSECRCRMRVLEFENLVLFKFDAHDLARAAEKTRSRVITATR